LENHSDLLTEQVHVDVAVDVLPVKQKLAGDFTALD
jgi:hypothetical protein